MESKQQDHSMISLNNDNAGERFPLTEDNSVSSPSGPPLPSPCNAATASLPMSSFPAQSFPAHVPCPVGLNSPGLHGLAMLYALEITPGNAAVSVHSSCQLRVIGSYTDSTTRDLTKEATWYTQDSKVAIISRTGLVAGLRIGKTVVVASIGLEVAQLTLSVTTPSMVAVDTDNNAPTTRFRPASRIERTASARSDSATPAGALHAAG